MSTSVSSSLKKGDNVEIITGKEKGKRGKILKVDSLKGRVFVERLNLVKRHTKQQDQKKPGGILEKEASIDLSNVMIFCNKCNKPVRIAKIRLDDGKSVRACVKCKEQFE